MSKCTMHAAEDALNKKLTPSSFAHLPDPQHLSVAVHLDRHKVPESLITAIPTSFGVARNKQGPIRSRRHAPRTFVRGCSSLPRATSGS